MMKWLRKHNRTLLMVFMAFLMVVFVAGSALQDMLLPSPGLEVQFETDYGEVNANQMAAAGSETSLLEQMGVDWQQPALIGQPIAIPDWIMLKQEAMDSGYRPNVALARSSVADEENRRLLETRAHQLRVKPEAFYQASANWDMVRSAGNAVARAFIPSEAEIRAEARAMLDKVRISAVLLNGRAFIDRDQEFTDAELRAFFDKYKAVERGRGLGEFGYFRSHAVKLEYIKIDHDAIMAELRAKAAESEALEEQLWREARQHYDTYATQGNFEYRKPPADVIAPDREPGSPVAPEPPDSPFFSWEEAKDKAYDYALEARANQSVERIGSWLVRRLTEPWVDSERGEDRYKKPPPGFTEPGFLQSVVAAIPARINYPSAITVTTTNFFTEDGVLDVPDIGRAYYATPNSLAKGLARLAFQTQGVVPMPSDASPMEYLARYQPCRYLLRAKRDSGSGYIFRVIDVRNPRPAESVDEVYNQVVSDLRTHHGLERAKQHAQSLMDAARETGSLKEAFTNHEELKTMSEQKLTSAMVRFVEPPPFARLDLDVPASQRDRSMVKVEGLGNLPRDLAEKLFKMSENPDPLTVIELPAWPAVIVVQWHESIPGRQDEFEQLRSEISQGLMIDRRITALRNWYDPEKIRARNGYKLVQ